MAPGGKCPRCKYYLFVKDERWEKYGVTVWYECASRTCSYAIKKFLPRKPRRS
jgi:hypothetical protein